MKDGCMLRKGGNISSLTHISKEDLCLRATAKQTIWDSNSGKNPQPLGLCFKMHDLEHGKAWDGGFDGAARHSSKPCPNHQEEASLQGDPDP